MEAGETVLRSNYARYNNNTNRFTHSKTLSKINICAVPQIRRTEHRPVV